MQEASAQLSDPRSPPKEVTEEDIVLSASEDEELNKNSRKRASSQPLDKANLLFRGSKTGDPKFRKEGKTAEEAAQANGRASDELPPAQLHAPGVWGQRGQLHD